MTGPEYHENPIAEAVNEFDQLYPRHVGGSKYSVLSTRNDSVTGHTVNIEQLTCTCEDEVFNLEGHQVCDHVAAALFVAPRRLSLDQQAVQFLLEAIQTVNYGQEAVQARTQAPQVSSDGEADSGPAAAETETMDETETDSAADLFPKVEAWIESVHIDPNDVTLSARAHDGTPGISVDWMKADLGDDDHEWFKNKLNGLEGSSYHAGWMDDGCQTCGNKDGDGFYHIPTETARGLTG